MIEKKIIAIFKLEDGDTEYTMFDDMTYRCDHWPEDMWSDFIIQYGMLSVCHRSEGCKNGFYIWITCPDSEMLCYQLLRERFELELAIHNMIARVDQRLESTDLNPV